MKKFISISKQKKPVCFLTALIKKNIIPHALLFTGGDRTGKKDIARSFAAACNCLNPKDSEACGVCKSCKKILSGTHPDIIELSPKGSIIRIDQIRDLSRTISMKPYKSKIRAVIIYNAESMNIASSNALLKALEEPAKNTIFILTALHSQNLLPTIVSRCQRFRFGTPELVYDLYDQKLTNYRKWLIETISELSAQTLSESLALAEKLYKEKKKLETALDIIESFFRDIAVFKFCPEKIINSDIKEKISSFSSKLDMSSILSKLKLVKKVKDHAQSDSVSRAMIEIMIMRLTNA